MLCNTKAIRLACKSKYNLKPENQVILLMISDGKKWDYLAAKCLPALLREMIKTWWRLLLLLLLLHIVQQINLKNIKKYVKSTIIVT